MFTDSLTVLSHVEVFLCASLSLWFRLLPLLLIQVLSALTHFLPLFLYYFLGNGLKQNTQNSYPGLYIWSAWANVSTSSYISINLLPLFISSFFKWYFCHFFCLFFVNPDTTLCSYPGIKAEEWGTFLHCKNQVCSSFFFQLRFCFLCREFSDVCAFLNRSSQILWKFVKKSKQRRNAVRETTKWEKGFCVTLLTSNYLDFKLKIYIHCLSCLLFSRESLLNPYIWRYSPPKFWISRWLTYLELSRCPQ